MFVKEFNNFLTEIIKKSAKVDEEIEKKEAEKIEEKGIYKKDIENFEWKLRKMYKKNYNQPA
jgi:hypothetical protein